MSMLDAGVYVQVAHYSGLVVVSHFTVRRKANAEYKKVVSPAGQSELEGVPLIKMWECNEGEGRNGEDDQAAIPTVWV